MTRIANARAVWVALACFALAACAAPPPVSPADQTPRQRSNAEKQEALQEMLDKGQRN